MKRISVIIPSYNHESFIGDAIRSVAAQAVPDLELVIIDDGSTDESVKQIRAELERTSIDRVIFRQQENRGAHDAIMRGIRESSGEIVALLNSDDRFAPDRFERMAPYFAGRDEFIAFSMVRVIGASGATLPDWHPTAAGYRHALDAATCCPTVGFGLLCNNFAVTSGNFVFSRSLYERIGGFSKHRLAHDWDFLLQSLVHVEPIFVPEALIDYRIHASNTIHTVEDLKEEEGSNILNRFLARCGEGTENPLAPCPKNWPLYFDLFTARHAPWFGGPSIRSWIDDSVEVDSSCPGRPDWHSWAEAVGFDLAGDYHYITDPGSDPAILDSLVLAREVLMPDSHPLAHDSADSAMAALRVLFERCAHPLRQARRAPARSDRGGDAAERKDPDDAALVSRTAPKRGAYAQRTRSALGRRLRALGTLRGATTWEIERSRLFDAEYYVAANGVSSLPKSKALRHFLETGAKQGLVPHPLFDTSYYNERNPDVACSDMNPLIHYLAHGAKEGRDPHPLFRSSFYLENNPDVARSGMNPLSHYVRHGAFEGREPHPRFDSEFYRARSPEPIPDDVSPLAHYVLVGAELGIPISRTDELHTRLEPETHEAASRRPMQERGSLGESMRCLRFSGFFDAADYSRELYSHAEVIDPFRHFIEIGSLEGLPFCSPETLTERMLRIDERGGVRPEFDYLRDSEPGADPRDARVELRVCRDGSPLYQEMAELLADELDRLGAEVRIADENDESDTGATHSLIFAPHEFFTLRERRSALDEDLLARSLIFMAEAPGSPWFSMGVWFAQRAAGVLDVNPGSASVWQEMGFRARFLPLGRDQSAIGAAPAPRESILCGALGREAGNLVPAPEDSFGERPIDILFDGESSARRRRFFATEAPLFASLRCALFMPTPNLEPSSGPESALRRCEAAVLSRHAKIFLGVRREEVPVFDWYRGVVRGMGHGALLVAEEGMSLPGLSAEKHYFERPLAKIPALLHWLLETPDGRGEAESVRRRGLQALSERFAPDDVLRRFLQDRKGAPSRHGSPLDAEGGKVK